MPDYASILKRSIETLPEKTPELRQAVYERARTALARQLISVDPPLNPEAVELQHQHLEEAILKAESYRGKFCHWNSRNIPILVNRRESQFTSSEP